MKFTKIPETAFQEIVLNAGILLENFDPTTGEYELTDIIGATSGGVNFEAPPEFSDFGEDIDNCPVNVMEFKRKDSEEVTMSGTFITLTANLAKLLVGAADIGSPDTTKIIPRKDLATTDFKDIWWVGDYSDKNGETNGGFVAIHMMNGLSTGGFRIQSGNREKGQFEFEFTGHYSLESQDTVPYEIYVKAGTAETE